MSAKAWNRGAWGAVLVAATWGLGATGAGTDLFARARVRRVPAGQRAFAFRLRTLQRAEAALTDFRGRLVALNFWAAACGPCQLEWPSLEQLYQQFRGEGFVVLGVSPDPGEADFAVHAFVRSWRLTFPVLRDPGTTSAKGFRVESVPQTVLIARKGYLVGVADGPRGWSGKEAAGLIAYLLKRVGPGGSLPF